MNFRKAGIPLAGIALCLLVGVVPTVAGADTRPLKTDLKAHLKAGLKAVEDGKLVMARTLAGKIKNPLARKILDWARFGTPDPQAGFSEIAAFLDANPDWPDRNGLQRRAEEALGRDTPDETVIAWFNTRKPLSGYGKVRLGEAFLFQGRRDEGRVLIRDAWVHGNFTGAREKSIYRRHRSLLTKDDHRRRLDRLQWDGRYWPARRMLWRVKPEYRALGTARLFLRHNLGNVDKAIAKVSDALKSDAGLQYERLRWRRKRGKYASAREILDASPNDLIRPVRWWKERSVIARSMLRDGLISEAYRLVQKHGLRPTGGKVNAAFAEAEWLAGWIALRFLQDAASAEAHFRNMYEAVRYPVSRARGAYWTARAIEAASGSRNVPAASTWHRLAALHPTTYYGQLSHARLNPVDGMELADKPEPLGQETETFNGQELVHAVRMLADIDALEWLRPFIFRLDGMKDAPGWRQLTLELAETSGRPDLALKIAKREGRESWKFTENAFPTLDPPALPAHLGMPPPEKPLVLAVVRQESAFDLSARSHANAQGLMQLMPKTASRVARNLNLSFSKKRLVSDAKYNLTLGQAYLAGLLKDFKGSYVLALAAYNAGPKRVHQWLRQFGDLRKPEVDSIDWVESIPFRETRNYVQRVLENLQVYRFRLADTEIALRLKDDLHQ